MKKLLLILTLLYAALAADNCFRLDPSCRGKYQNTRSYAKCYVQTQYSYKDNYAQSSRSYADGYVQNKRSYDKCYIQDRYPYKDGYVEDVGVFGIIDNTPTSSTASNNCFRLDPSCRGDYQNTRSYAKCYVQTKYSYQANYAQSSSSYSRGYVQNTRPYADCYIQDKYSYKDGYVKDVRIFGLKK
jgi:hypothetical protein